MKERHQDPNDMEGYDEVLRKLLESLPLEERFIGLSPEQRVAGLSTEERVTGLSLEERFAGLSTEERLLTLPDEALRALSDDYVRTLSHATQDILRTRIGRPA